MSNNLYYNLYNNLKEEDFESFINRFLDKSDNKVLLKISDKDSNLIDKLKIDPKENSTTVYNMKIASLFCNACLTGNLDLVKYIDKNYDAINKWKELPELYYQIPYLDPVYSITEYGYIEILNYLSSENAIDDKYFQLDDFTAKINNIAGLVRFEYSQEQIIHFLKTIYNINESTIIKYYGLGGKEFIYNFDDIKNKIRVESSHIIKFLQSKQDNGPD